MRITECKILVSQWILKNLSFTLRETLINPEFPQHKDVLPYSMAVKPLNMKKKVKSQFTFFVL